MRASRWVPAAAAAVLVVGVLAARDGSAAEESDLRPPVADPGPSPAPLPEEEAPLTVEANGLPGARLGSTGEELAGLQLSARDGTVREASAADVPGGCLPAWQSYDGEVSWDTTVWVVDGLVSSVVLARWDSSSVEVERGLRTWLGPTLGSPIAEAEALPGARARTERPFGVGGPEVRVVHVRGPGVETVFSDVVFDGSVRADGGTSRITTVEVRHPRAAGCSSEALSASGVYGGGGGGPDLEGAVLGPDGLTLAPIGTPSAALAGVPGLTSEPETGVTGCEVWYGTTPEGGWLRVAAVDGVVAGVQADGVVSSTMPVRTGDTLEQVRAAYPEAADEIVAERGDELRLTVGQRLVTIGMWPQERWVPDVDVPVLGGEPVVRSLGVRSVDTPSAAYC